MEKENKNGETHHEMGYEEIVLSGDILLREEKKVVELNWFDQHHKTIDLFLKVILAGVGFFITLALSSNQNTLRKEIEKNRIIESDREKRLSNYKFYSNLLNPILNGSRTEKILSLEIMRAIDQVSNDTIAVRVFQANGIPNLEYSRVSTAIFESVAISDPDDNVRTKAIEALENQGTKVAQKALENIRTQALEKSNSEELVATIDATLEGLGSRQSAQFNSLVAKANTFLRIEAFKEAAQYFLDATQYKTFSSEEESKILLADLHFQQGGYKAATNVLLKLLTKN